MAEIDDATTHRVEIRWRGPKLAEVTVLVDVDDEQGLSPAVILQRAWAEVAEAITEEKKRAEESTAASESGEEPSSTAEPGGGAWWTG